MSSWKQQTLIEAPVAKVWEILVDPARGPDWDQDVIAVTGAPTKIEKGSTFDVTARGPLHVKSTTTLKCQFSGFYAHWLLTDAQDSTFAELELGIEPLESRPPRTRAAEVLHTKNYLRRQVDKLLDSLRGAVSRDSTSTS
jgi:hypothetical protein